MEKNNERHTAQMTESGTGWSSRESETLADGTTKTHDRSFSNDGHGHTQVLDTYEKSATAFGVKYATSESIAEDEHGHRVQTRTESFQTGNIRQAESVSTHLASGEQALDLSDALHDKHASDPKHQFTHLSSTTTVEADKHTGETIRRTHAVAIDPTGRTSGYEDAEVLRSSSSSSEKWHANIASQHKSTSAGDSSAGMEPGAVGQRFSQGGSEKWESNTAGSQSHSALTGEARAALKDHLVSKGFSASDAYTAVEGSALSLGMAAAAHVDGSNSHTHVSFESNSGGLSVGIVDADSTHGGKALSSGNDHGTSASVSMDTLKHVNEQGLNHQGVHVIRETLGHEVSGMSGIEVTDTFGHATVAHAASHGIPHSSLDAVQSSMNAQMGETSSSGISKAEALQVMGAAITSDATHVAFENGHQMDLGAIRESMAASMGHRVSNSPQSGDTAPAQHAELEMHH